MSRRVGYTLLAGAVVAFAVLGSSARADVVNGGFETTTPPVPAGGLITVPAGGTGIAPWTVTGTDVLVINTTYAEDGLTFNAFEGRNALDITGNNNSNPNNAISQTLATTAGQGYLLTFALGHAFEASNPVFQGPASVKVSISGTPLSNLVFTNASSTPHFINWQVGTVTFIATGPSTTLTFTNNTPVGTNYAGLDAISVVPEPGVLTLAGAGLPLFLGLAWLRRRLSR